MDLLKLIGCLQEKRRQEKITPDHVPEVELMNAIHAEARKELNDLYVSGKIGIVKTLNSNAVYAKEEYGKERRL